MPSVLFPTRSKRDFVMGLGAKGVLNRKDFNCWGQLPTGQYTRIRFEWIT